MIDITHLLRGYAALRYIELGSMDPRSIQERLLKRLLRRAQDTVFGNEHHFSEIDTVEKYPNPTPTISRTTSRTIPDDYYLVYANNRCVEVIPNPTNASGNTQSNSLGWTMNPCNASNPNQQFKLNSIANMNTYNNMIYNDVNKAIENYKKNIF